MPLYVTDDSERWGSGVGRVLEADEIDRNVYELRSAINAILADLPTPKEIVSTSATGRRFYFNLSDGSQIGPIYIPIITWVNRGLWEPIVQLNELDLFRVIGVGLYYTLIDHITEAAFDPNLTIDGNPAYFELFRFAPPLSDIGFGYPGPLAEVSSTYLYLEPMTRQTLLPKVPLAGSAHQAWLQIPATVNAQTLNIYKNDVVIGNITFAIGEHIGIVSITADTTLVTGDRLAVGNALVADATAAEVAIVLAAQQTTL